VPAERAEEARAQWLELFPAGFEEVDRGEEIELAAYTDDDPPPGARVEEVEDGWEDRWRDFHRPVRVGPFWIGPPWEEPPGDAVPVVIDPGQAFGTGAHPTTQLCVRLVSELAPASLVDVGCGSGVISIAAAMLGFAPVIALDADPAAVEATLRNADVNGVPLDVRELDATTDPLPPSAIVVANVSLPVVEALLPRLQARIVVTSGYLEGDKLQFGPYVRRERHTLGGWAADVLQRAQ
jgi:ribosomal protein L11 methyltransferase